MENDLDLQQKAAATFGINLDDKAKEIERKLGSFNDFPPNIEVITQSHFLWLWNVSPANRTYQYRQALVRGLDGQRAYGEPMHELHFWVFPDFSGIGWETHYNGKATRSREDAFHCMYFKFEYCKHDFETITARMGYWEGRCIKCEYRTAVDSSG